MKYMSRISNAKPLVGRVVDGWNDIDILVVVVNVVATKPEPEQK